jgi:hypothetical protein
LRALHGGLVVAGKDGKKDGGIKKWRGEEATQMYSTEVERWEDTKEGRTGRTV